MSIQKITRIALLSAILYVSKVALEFLPNIELVSLLVVLYSLVFGWETIFIVTVFNLFELIQWGFGTWWFSYLYVWPLLCVITMLLKKADQRRIPDLGNRVRKLWIDFSGHCLRCFICLWIRSMRLPIGSADCLGMWCIASGILY